MLSHELVVAVCHEFIFIWLTVMSHFSFLSFCFISLGPLLFCDLLSLPFSVSLSPLSFNICHHNILLFRKRGEFGVQSPTLCCRVVQDAAMCASNTCTHVYISWVDWPTTLVASTSPPPCSICGSSS